VVDWSMSASMTAQLVADAMLMAILHLGKPDGLVRPANTRASSSST
jgi:putative transposase